MSEQSVDAVIAVMRERFTSLNLIPVERAYIKASEWATVIAEIDRLRAALLRHACHCGPSDPDPNEHAPR